MNPIANARRLRRSQTEDEKQLWHALRAGRFAGFKFRRQHPIENFVLDFYCPTARLAIELDGFRHGFPEMQQHDAERQKFLEQQNIRELRFWNHQWRRNRQGVLLEIWNALHQQTGCVAVLRKEENHRFVPPDPKQIKNSNEMKSPSP